MLLRELLRQRRQAAGLTTYDIADCVGVRAATVTRWETGEVDPPLSRVLAWAGCVGADVVVVDSPTPKRRRGLAVG